MANFDTIIESADQSLLLKIPFKIKKRMIEFLLRFCFIKRVYVIFKKEKKKRRRKVKGEKREERRVRKREEKEKREKRKRNSLIQL